MICQHIVTSLRTVTFVSIMLMSSVVASVAAALSIDLGTHELSMRLPSGESKEYPVIPVVSRLDMNCGAGPGGSVIIVDKHWDYFEGLWKRNVGTLGLKIRVRRASDIGSPASFDDLIALINRQLHEAFDESNQKKRASGSSELIVELPDTYERFSLDGVDWVKYKLVGYHDSTIFVTLLDDCHYLQAQFNLVSNSGKANAPWKGAARANIDEIMSSIKVTKKTP